MEGIVSVKEVKETQKEWKRDFFKDIIKNFPGAAIQGGLIGLTAGGVLSCVAGGISLAVGAKDLGYYLLAGGMGGAGTGAVSYVFYAVCLGAGEGTSDPDAITKFGRSIKDYQKLRKIHFTEFYREYLSWTGELESDLSVKERITEYLRARKEEPSIIKKTLEDMSEYDLV